VPRSRVQSRNPEYEARLQALDEAAAAVRAQCNATTPVRPVDLDRSSRNFLLENKARTAPCARNTVVVSIAACNAIHSCKTDLAFHCGIQNVMLSASLAQKGVLARGAGRHGSDGTTSSQREESSTSARAASASPPKQAPPSPRERRERKLSSPRKSLPYTVHSFTTCIAEKFAWPAPRTLRECLRPSNQPSEARIEGRQMRPESGA